MNKSITFICGENLQNIQTISEYTNSFKKYSKFDINYVYWRYNMKKSKIIKKIESDILIINYCVIGILRILYVRRNPVYIKIKNMIRRFKGLKIVFIQDEYTETELNKKILKDLNINILFSCVPQNDISKVYDNLNNVKFYNVLTGYVPNFNKKELIKTKDRNIDIFYRGRRLHYIYGDLGQDKMNIGIKMIEYLKNQYDIKYDISCSDKDRIYGDKWYEYLESSKVMLATESGSNIFNINNELLKNINDFLETNEDNHLLEKDQKYTYKTVKKKFNLIDGPIKMNQISPKLFEAALFKTVLVMFEGEYSGIFTPNIHYIPLNKDFSNIEDIILKVQDDNYLQNMADRTYKDIIESKKYSYKNFIDKIDKIILENINKVNKVEKYWSEHTVMNHVKIKSIKENKKYIKHIDELYPLYMKFFHLYDIHKDEVILDYGCGPGNDLVGFQLYSQYKKLIGIDISNKALEKAKDRLMLQNDKLDNIELIKINEENSKIPLLDNSIDYIQSSGVIHHTSNPINVLKELHRILKKGKICRIMVYHKNSLFINLIIPYLYQIKQNKYPSLTAEEVFYKIADAGAPIARLNTDISFKKKAERAGFKCNFINAAFSKTELIDVKKNIKNALNNEKFPKKHKDFLLKIKFINNYPVYDDKYYAGMNAIFELKKI